MSIGSSRRLVTYGKKLRDSLRTNVQARLDKVKARLEAAEVEKGRKKGGKRFSKETCLAHFQLKEWKTDKKRKVDSKLEIAFEARKTGVMHAGFTIDKKNKGNRKKFNVGFDVNFSRLSLKFYELYLWLF